MKILPLHRYKLTKNGFRVEYFNPRRFFILLTFVLSLIGYSLWENREYLILQASPMAEMFAKSEQQVAIEKFIISTRPNITANIAEDYAEHIIKYSKLNSVDPFLLVGLMRTESHFDRYAISESNALGLTQVIPKWHKDKIAILTKRFGSFDIFNPEHNIALGAMVLGHYKAASNGSNMGALLKYNASEDKYEYANTVLKAKKEVARLWTA